MLIELKVKCFNPGCDINFKVADPSLEETDISETLSQITDEVIRLMSNRELKSKYENLTITTSDGGNQQEINF